MTEKFQDLKLTGEVLGMITMINRVIEEYKNDGLRLSVRQIHYIGVSSNWWENTDRQYKRLIKVVGDGRLAGLIDWDMIEDRNRFVYQRETWLNIGDALQDAADRFRMNKWLDQPNYVEVMVEKAALEGVLIPVCRKEGTPFSANRGYSSLSAMYEAGHRFRERYHVGKKKLHVIYLGDHDPSGLDMSRDIGERLTQFAHAKVEVHRIALNMDQVEKFNPPENPVKFSDSRAEGYRARFGDHSWELDALGPKVIANLVSAKIKSLRSDYLWNEANEREEELQSEFQEIVDRHKKGGKK